MDRFAVNGVELSDQRQEELRQWFRRRYTHGVRFNRWCGLRVDRWEPSGVEIALPFRENLSGHSDLFHGGVLSALIDTTGGAAVMAGHDFAHGSLMSTISLTVNFLMPARAPLVVAHGVCVKRGRRVNFSEVQVRDAEGQLCASGQVSLIVVGERPDLDEEFAD